MRNLSAWARIVEGHDPATALVHALRDEYVNGQGKTPREINSGQCFDFSEELERRYPEYFECEGFGNFMNHDFAAGQDCDDATGFDEKWHGPRGWKPPEGMTWDDLFHGCQFSWDGTHGWAYCAKNGRYYDIENPDGVTDVFQLAFLQRIIAGYRAHRASKPVAESVLEERFGTTEKLYHGTNIDNLWLIMKDGKLTSNVHGRDYPGPTGVCLSRSLRVASDHASSWAGNLESSFFEYFGIEARHDFSGTAVFEFDRAKIQQPLIPFNDFGHGEGDDDGEEEEERVVGDLPLNALSAIYVRKGELEEFLKYAVAAHKAGGSEYTDEFKQIIGNVLSDPRLKTF